MSISAVLNRWLNRLYKVLAILLVLFAVLISAFRLSLPYVHHFQQNFQYYLNETYDSNVTIGSLSMEWATGGPTLIVKQVNVLDTETANVFVARMEITIDFWGSLQHQKLITQDIALAGAQVIFDKTLLAQQSKTQRDNSLIDSISHVFFTQISRFSLTKSKITLQDDAKTRTFVVDQLSWVNSDNHHRATGSMLIDGLTSNNIKFNLDASGKDLRDLSGQLYFEANKLNVTPWLDSILAIENEKTYSSVNFSAWYTLNKGKANKLQIELGDNEVSWIFKDELQSLRIEKGNILVENFDNATNRVITTTPLEFYTNNKAWQPLTVDIKRTAEGLVTHISSLDLFGLADLYPLFSGHSESQEILKNLAPVGQINDIYLLVKDDDIKVHAQFSEVTSFYSQGIPGIENVSGELSFAQNNMSIKLLAENGQLNFDNNFLYPIPYQSIAAQVDVDFTTADLSVKVNQIEIISEQLHATAELEIKAFENAPLTMALLANVYRGDAKFIHYYYPHLLMGKDLVDYLNSAIIEGNVEQAQILFNGPLDKFPFQDNSGVFIVDAELTDSKFKFDPLWPVINNFAANLNFTSNSMLISARGGDLTGIDVSDVKVAIDDLAGEQVLTVEGDFKDTQPSAISNLMNDSPMKDTVGETLNQLRVSKNISGSFALNLPLNDLDSVVASGKVEFNNNQVALQTPDMNFTEVNGELTYTNDVINTEGLTLNWRDMPLALKVVANNNNSEYYQTLINLQAQWPESFWKKELPKSLENYGSGQLDWLGDLTLKMHHQGGVSYELLIDSTFEKLAFELPAPYNKKAGEVLNVAVNVSGHKASSILNVQVGDELNFYGELNHKQVQFTKAHLILGIENMLLPAEGFHITTNLAKASVTEWQSLVFDILDSIDQAPENLEEDSIAILSAPKKIQGEIGELDVLGQTLTDVSFDLLDQEQWWLLDIKAKEAIATVKIHSDWHKQGIDIDADFIHLAQDQTIDKNSDDEVVTAEKSDVVVNVVEEKTPVDNDVLFANLPPIRAKCASCTYGKIDLGEVEFSLEKSAKDTLKIKKFTAKRGKTSLSFNGNWQHNEKISQTTLTGKLKAKHFDDEIEKLGYPSTIKDSELDLKYDLNWIGSPLDFKLENFNGTSRIVLSDGYLAEVPDQARAFSLLSLQSLVRKLKFDFRDMFSDGMFYDSIKGDFEIKQGLIYTNNTFMKGAAGDLTIQGNTNLSEEILDYKMSYKPNITSSLPAIAWIATLNPLVLIGAVALDGVITSKVVSEYKIEVTGPIAKPIVKIVDKKTQNIKVGRSTPPEIIDTLPEDKIDPAKTLESSGIKEQKEMNKNG
ncbi:MAG: TIGR02099 family protein [Colwellia sp.]|nr:TIGR02099 family protein [Colwellia sp.]